MGKDIREELKNRLWHRDFTREIDRYISEALVSPLHRSKYLGMGLDPFAIDDDGRYQRAIVRLMGSLLIGKYLDKCIDIVIEEYDELLLNAKESIEKEG